jgi:hypothetical protein
MKKWRANDDAGKRLLLERKSVGGRVKKSKLFCCFAEKDESNLRWLHEIVTVSFRNKT